MANFDRALEQAAVSDAVSGFHKSNHFTDLTVRCGDKTFNVHKVIVSASSDWFKTALTGRFKEASSRKIPLVDDNEDDISKMLHFCYNLDYTEDSNAVPMTLHARMFALGEKYLMPSLQSYAVSKFQTASFDITDFAAAVKECYSNSLDPKRLLKKPIVELSIKHADKLFGSETSDADFRQMIDKLPEYASDVLHETYKVTVKTVPVAKPKRYRCPANETRGCQGTVALSDMVQCSNCGMQWDETNTPRYDEYWRNREV